MASPLEQVKVELSSDKTQAIFSMRAAPTVPEEGDDVLTPEMLASYLRSAHSLSFLLDDVIAKVVERAARGEMIQPIVIADSKRLAKAGVDGRLEWLIDSEQELDQDEIGRVDFYSFSNLKNVIKDQPLAVLHPEELGVDGVTVTGEPLLAPVPKTLEISAGENCEYRERERTFYALIGGRVELRGNVMLVSRSFQVDGNVDFSTGNIVFDGSVRVTGNVVDNFSIEATEGVQVDGVVEAAFIKSGGTVAVLGGINMREKGQITAKSDVVTRFINNSSVRCGGNLAAEKEILNSKIIAGSVISQETEVAGGSISVTGNIQVKEAGSPLGVKTILRAGFNQDAVDELEALEKDIAQREANEAELEKKLAAAQQMQHKLTPDKRAGLTALVQRSKAQAKETKEMKDQIIVLRKKINKKDAQIIINKAVYAGVVLKIGKYEKSLMEDYTGFRRYVYNEEKYEIEALFD